MKEDYHIDMSGRIYEGKNIGVAFFVPATKKHKGCALKGNLIKYIQKNLCQNSVDDEYAKLYAIIIFLLIKEDLDRIKSLIICNDENFVYVKKYLFKLIGENIDFEIKNITEFRQIFGRKIKSPADNFANCYRRRALNKNKWQNGKSLNVVQITFQEINNIWNTIKNKSE